MSVLTIAAYRLHDPECVLDDSALQARIDAVEQEIDQRFGPVATATDFLLGGGPWLFPTRPVLTVTEIGSEYGDTVTILDPTDYEIIDGGRTIRRVSVGAVNPASRWSPINRVTYVPRDTAAIRIGVEVDVLKFDLGWSGFTSRTMGRWSETQGSGRTGTRESERDAILSRLAPGVYIA